MTFEVTLRDQRVERVDGADSYRQEGQMTTFFAHEGDRPVADCWSTPVASFRTSEVFIIRRVLSPDELAPARPLRSA